MVKKKNAILAPLGVLLGMAVFGGIGYGLYNAGMQSMDVFVKDTMVWADTIFSGKSRQALEAEARAQAAVATAPVQPQQTEAAQEEPVYEETSQEAPSDTHTTVEGYSGTIDPNHVSYNGEVWISRTDNSGRDYWRTSVYIPAYGGEYDICDYGAGWCYTAQEGQPIYYDEATGEWTVVDPYEPWVRPW